MSFTPINQRIAILASMTSLVATYVANEIAAHPDHPALKIRNSVLAQMHESLWEGSHVSRYERDNFVLAIVKIQAGWN